MMTRFDRNPYRLARDGHRGWVAGVCAGIADHLGIGVAPVRVVAVLALTLFFVPTVVIYLVLAVVLPRKPAGPVGDADEAAFWRGLASDPPRGVRDLRRRMADIERRVVGMEAFVTSEEFELRRGFDGLRRP
jgi:phage shock protein C